MEPRADYSAHRKSLSQGGSTRDAHSSSSAGWGSDSSDGCRRDRLCNSRRGVSQAGSQGGRRNGRNHHHGGRRQEPVVPGAAYGRRRFAADDRQRDGPLEGGSAHVHARRQEPICRRASSRSRTARSIKTRHLRAGSSRRTRSTCKPDARSASRAVDNGKKGWDTPFTEKQNGDSWVAQAKGDTQSRKVTAKSGTTLYYFCLVHPFMQGKIKVVK